MKQQVVTDCQEHVQKQKLNWDIITETIIIRNINPHYNYLLITNSINIVSNLSKKYKECQLCKANLIDLQYSFDNKHSFHSEFTALKYCMLVLDQNGTFLKLLGTTQFDQYYRGNLLVKHLKDKQNQKEHIIDVDPNETLFQKSQVNNLNWDKVNNSNETFQKCQQKNNEKQKNSEENEGKRQEKKKEEIEEQQCILFVTKLQKQIENVYRANMFHEYVWLEEEIYFIMSQIKSFFGEYNGMIQKRRYIKFAFKRNKSDHLFWEKWNNRNREILLRKNKVVDGKIVNYYVLSKEPILNNEQLTNKLFLLPNNAKIVDLCLADPWVVIAAESYAIFIHSYKPMDFFKHEDKIYPTKVVASSIEKGVVVILNKEGSVLCYKLEEKSVILLRVFTTSFLKPFCLAEMDNSIYLGGIDIEKGDNKVVNSSKRMIYKINQTLKCQIKNANKTIQIESSFEVVRLPKDKNSSPLTYLIRTSKDFLACSCLNKFYLYSLSGEKLVQIQLKSTITILLPIPFLFNLFNFAIVTSQKELIRLGIQSYGQTLGSELQRLKGSEARDCSLIQSQGAKWQILICQKKQINRRNYLKDQGEGVVREQKGQIIKLCSDKIGMTYLVDLQHSYELKYFEL